MLGLFARGLHQYLLLGWKAVLYNHQIGFLGIFYRFISIPTHIKVLAGISLPLGLQSAGY